MTLISHPQESRAATFARLHHLRHERAKDWRQRLHEVSPTSPGRDLKSTASESLPGHRGPPKVRFLAAGEQSRPPSVKDSHRQPVAATPGSAALLSCKKRKRHQHSPTATGVSLRARPLFKRRETLPKQTKDRLLCPFAASSVKGQSRCSGDECFESNGDVAKHLQEEHGRPPYCPHCYTVFDSDAKRDGHIRLRQCELREPKQIGGLTSKQVQELSRYVDVEEGTKETWARICLVVFSADKTRET